MQLVRRMNDVLAHRGPDDDGTWMNGDSTVFLGHRRLSIIDVSSRGKQPMLSPDGNAVVYNGEIYNFKELRKRYPGFDFASDSDTEVLLQHYANHKIEALQDLDGMFAFALWDASQDQLLLVRDRIGIKPLYYAENNGVFAFSSEIRSLLLLPWVDARLDNSSIATYLTFGKVAAPKTLYCGIKKLPPGHFITVGRLGCSEPTPYWEVDYQDLSGGSESEIVEQVYSHLQCAVRQRMVSDVPVGAFLSGGTDSSAVVALMRQFEPDAEIKTFSIGFENKPDYDELDYARSVAKRFSTRHYDCRLSANDVREFIPRIVEVFDEPLSDPTAIPIFFISELAASQGIKVVLTGDGADELFFGYRSWIKFARAYPLYNQLLKVPRQIRSPILRGSASLLGERNSAEMLMRAANGEELFWGGANSFKSSTLPNLFTKSFLADLAGSTVHDGIAANRRTWKELSQSAPGCGDLGWMCFFGIKDIVPNTYLYRADRLGMANSVELRVPFLDHRLVSLGLSIPDRLRATGGEPKYVLKKALEQLLPQNILYRSKMGFCVPIREWGGDIMLEYMEDNVSEFCRAIEILDETYLRKRIAAYRSGKTQNVHALWSLYFLMAWYSRWIASGQVYND